MVPSVPWFLLFLVLSVLWVQLFTFLPWFHGSYCSVHGFYTVPRSQRSMVPTVPLKMFNNHGTLGTMECLELWNTWNHGTVGTMERLEPWNSRNHGTLGTMEQ